MKSCPVCRRNFDDDTLLYCTEDGTPLTAPSRSGDPTLLVPGRRDTDPPATEVLPHGYQPPAPTNAATWPVQPSAAPSGTEPTQVAPTQFAGHVAPPVSYPPVAPAYQPAATPAAASNRVPWIIMSAVLGVVALGAIIGVAYLLLRSSGPSNNNSAQLVSTPVPNNINSTNANAGGSASNTNTGGEVSGTPDDWLYGEWEGSGTEEGSASVILIRDEDGTAISYADCGGSWEERSMDAETAQFTERITSGKNCDSGALVKVTRLSDNHIAASWIYENTDIPVTTVDLTRRTSGGH